MKYLYTVVKNGIWYPTGTEVPDDTDAIKSVKTYSKSEINRMPVAELRELAKKEGISGFEEKNGAELKKLLISKYGL